MSSRWITVAAVLTLFATQAPTAVAAINSPPAGGHEVTVFPSRDFVALDPWEPNADFRLELVRNGVVIGLATGTTDADGVREVNHPGGVCWIGVTPDILPGDIVRVFHVDGTGAPVLDGGGQPIGDATTTAGVSATQAQVIGSQLIVHGSAVSATGGPLPLGNLEQRIVEPALIPFVGRRDVSAPGGGNGFTSTLAYDPAGPGNPAGTNWTATYTGMSAQAMDVAAAGQTRVLSWMGTNAAGPIGLTIFEVGEIGGPGLGGCPAGARNAAMSPGVLNSTDLAAGAADVAFSGSTQPDATAVSLAISDGTITINATGVPTAGAWTVAVPAAQLATLADGPLTVVGTYTVPGGDVPGVNLDVVKDTAVPEAPTASPEPGTYTGTQSIVLHSADPTAEIHYSVNGTEPTAASPVAKGQISVTNTQTLKAIAIDPAGNKSAITSLDYVISPTAPVVIEKKTDPQVIVQPALVAPRLALAGLTMRKTLSRKSLRRSGLRAHAQLLKGTEVLRVRVYRGKKLVATAYRFPGRSGLYNISLKNRGVRSLKAGSYVLEVAAGATKKTLGAATRSAFRVR